MGLHLELHRGVNLFAGHRAQEPLLIAEDGGRVGADRISPPQHGPANVQRSTTRPKKKGGEKYAKTIKIINKPTLSAVRGSCLCVRMGQREICDSIGANKDWQR